MKSRVAGSGVLALTLVLSSLFGVRADAGYQDEVALEFWKGFGSDHFQRMGLALDVTHYLSEVEPNDGPLAEADFLAHVGNVGGWASWVEDRADNYEGDGPAFGVNLKLSAPNFPVWGGISYARSWLRFDSRGQVELNSEDVAAQVGLWLGRGLTMGVGYERYTRDIDGPGEMITESFKDLTGFGRWVWVFSGDQALALSGSLTFSRFDLGDEESGSDRILRGSLDYYVTQDLNFGVFGGWEQGDGDSLVGKNIGARARGFLTPTVSVSVSYDVFIPKTDLGSRYQQLIVAGQTRF